VSKPRTGIETRMPPLEYTERHDDALLWPLTGRGNYGEPLIDAGNPVELKVRWETRRDERVNREGTTIATVARLEVDREIAEGSLMRRGTLSEWRGTGSGDTSADILTVAIYEEVPDLRDREIYRIVSLSEYKGTLPGPLS
jgi:hypothetical protein